MRKRVAITMRTLGDDFALAAGFFFAEQIVTQPNERFPAASRH